MPAKSFILLNWGIYMFSVVTASAFTDAELTVAVILLFIAVVVLVVIQVESIVKNIKNKNDAEKLAEVDLTTGIGNRVHLAREYEKIPAEIRHEYALICFHLDSEHVERAFGRTALINYIKESITAIKEYASPDDSFARVIGAGLVALAHVDDDNIRIGLIHILRKIRSDITNLDPLFTGTIAAGVYRLKDTDNDVHKSIFNAWQTAEMAADAGEDYLFCTDELVKQFEEERSLRTEIGRAFDNHEFVTYIQFCVDTPSARIVGGEALARWNHPEKGILSPAKFIPFMERENIISRMDYYTLEEVCKFLEKVSTLGIRDFFISCNFSRKTYAEEDFVKKCEKIIQKYRFDRNMLVFEITESAEEKNTDVINQNSREIKELGIRILLDDFGEGFASFYDLHEYPIDGLKLDKALVDRYDTEKGNAILRGMTRMGHEMNLTVVVEGVESDEQVNELKNIKCDIIQGFRYHRPIPVADAWNTLVSETEKESKAV